jgi:hypothetical protein
MLAAALVCGCGELDPADGIFGPEVEEVVLEVNHHGGAEPCEGIIGGGARVWDVFTESFHQLFSAAPRVLTIRRAAIPDAPGGAPGSFDEQAILDLADAHREVESTDARRAFYVVFVDGYYRENGAEKRNILGRAIRGRGGVIAIFKPALARHGWFAEQAVVVHEFGHAVGLVNRGVEMVRHHQEVSAGYHCAVQGCIMRPGLPAFYHETGGAQAWYHGLFCGRCLEDAAAASAAAR